LVSQHAQGRLGRCHPSAADLPIRTGLDRVGWPAGDPPHDGQAASDAFVGQEAPRRHHLERAGDRVELGQPDAAIVAVSETFAPDGPTKADDPMLLYFTSGTTAKPKLVRHSQRSYPVGGLSTMYWLGLQPGDVHLNISSPGWAKHAWSCFFAPWNAGATVFVVNQPRFDAKALLATVGRCGVTTLCAPPTVWRLFIQERLADFKVSLREVCGAGEPLNPEVIDQVKAAWGLTIRDGYGQTETTAQVANSPGQPVKPGAMGRPLPGYRVALLDVAGRECDEGELCLALAPRPLGLMPGYQDDAERTDAAMAGGYYRTGDVARRDGDGYLTFVGRADDVFKASDYRISPFELESVLIEHAAVAEAAVVPSPDPLRAAVPKAFIVLAAGAAPTRETAAAIFAHVREHLASFKRVRRLEGAGMTAAHSREERRIVSGSVLSGSDGACVRRKGRSQGPRQRDGGACQGALNEVATLDGSIHSQVAVRRHSIAAH